VWRGQDRFGIRDRLADSYRGAEDQWR
jgi:hypothetical protein